VFSIEVEPQAPHRISWISRGFEPKVMATFGLKRAASVAVTEEERLQEVGSYLKRMADADLFSGVVVIAREGKPVFAQAYGYADREKKIPNTLETPFFLASMNKPFTGLAIGQLVEQGKLSYDDPLSKFLPDYPDAESAKKIKIKHLLSHTSGLGGDLFSPATEDAIRKVSTIQEWVEVGERKPLAFEPGTKWDYNNLGYVLLGRIIEIATGQSYYEYMEKNVFAPAGATSASFPLLRENGVPAVPMALPYEGDFDFENHRLGFQNQLGKGGRRGSSAGGGVASALDLLKLSNAMKAGRIVKPETLRLHTSPKPELNATGFGTGYGYGFFPTKYGRPFVGHGGNAPGMCTEFGELRDTPYTLIVLSNVTINTCIDVTLRILRVLRPTVFGLGLSLEPHPAGAVVRVVAPGGTGAAMGVQVGDILVELGGKPMSPQVVQEYLQKTKIGDPVVMKVKRADATLELTGKAMAKPAPP
jgi:CubicO group peptidase (beta-lactamase class C family)